MITLEEILKFAEENKACENQLAPFKKAIESGDELLAWQIVLGNINWLYLAGLKLDQLYVENKADNKAVRYQGYPGKDKVPHITYDMIDGKINGKSETFHEDGFTHKLIINYKNNRVVDKYKEFNSDGSIITCE